MTCRIAFLAILLFTGALPAQTRETANPASDTARAGSARRIPGKTTRIEGTPRSFQIARIPVPPEMTDAERVDFEVRAVNEFSIVGKSRGSVEPRRNPDVLVTIGVPGAARAGTRAAAYMLFRTASLEVEVPIEMTVIPIYGLMVHAPEQLTNLRAGDQFDLQLRIQNRGNVLDTVTIAVELPVGWRINARDTTRITVPGYTTLDRVLRIGIPINSGTGSFFVRTFARSREARAQALTTLTVGPASNQLHSLGPAVRATVGSVAVQGEGVQTVSQLEVTGPLTSSIHIDGRLTTTPSLTSPLVRGLARVGTYISAPHFTAWSANWRLNAGSTVLAMSELTGLNAGGRGVAFEYADSARRAAVLAARSDEGSAAGNNSGELLGAHFEHSLRLARFGATATHLSGVGLQHHQLTAFALQAQTHQINTLTFGGETAYRDYAAGTGIGWSARVQHESNDARGMMRFTHAPGGTEAFARAENELTASFVKGFDDRFDMAGTFFSATDDNIGGRAFESRSFGLTPSYRVHERLRLRADLRHNSFDVIADPLGYGNDETHFGLGAGGMWRGLALSSDVSLARISRSVTAPDIDASELGARFVWRGGASRFTETGAFHVEASYERNGAATGYLPEQFMLTARSDRFEIPAISSRLQFDAELTVHAWTGVRPMPVIRAGLNYAMPLDIDVAVAVERNPLLAGLRDETPWIVALKLEKAVRVPRLAVGRASGSVYRDLNGNGRRDLDEPGEANVTVRRGSARAVTGSDGSYRFWENVNGELIADPATLPFGWVISERKNGDIALVPTTRVEVTVQLGATERLRNIDISGLIVVARDAQGREWSARRVRDDLATFDALPVGTYTLDADFTALAEPLRVEGGVVTVQVTEGITAKVVLQLAGRPLRFKQNQ
jgi:hypothetical protein